jgi:hypothetical protein
VALAGSFDGETEGWKAAANEGSGLLGLCLEGVTCPRVTDEFHATGGIGDSGYIETEEGGVGVLGLVATNTGVWESPEFTYMGVAGQRATTVELTLARRAQLASLLALSGAGADYTVELVDRTDKSGSVVVVSHSPLSGAEEWKTATMAISPTSLKKGDAYKLLIRTTFATPAALVPAGGVGYDNVELTASRDEVEEGPRGPEGPAGGGGGGGSNGSSGADGSGGGSSAAGGGGATASNGINEDTSSADPSIAELREVIVSQGLAGTAGLQHRRLIITGMCPQAIPGACTVRVKGLLNRHKVATSSARAKIAPGAKHRFAVTVGPQALAKVRRQGSLLVKEWVRVGATRVVVFKKVKLVAR